MFLRVDIPGVHCGFSSMEKATNDENRGVVMRNRLRSWLNKNMKIKMTDGRTLIGIFLCTDKDKNVILGSCSEYLKVNGETSEEPRVLGLAMVPGHHIVSIHIDDCYTGSSDIL